VHDLIGHSLTAVGLEARSVRRPMDSAPERAKAEFVDIERLAAEMIAGVRSTVSGARATTLVEQLAPGRVVVEDDGVGLGASKGGSDSAW